MKKKKLNIKFLLVVFIVITALISFLIYLPNKDFVKSETKDTVTVRALSNDAYEQVKDFNNVVSLDDEELTVFFQNESVNDIINKISEDQRENVVITLDSNIQNWSTVYTKLFKVFTSVIVLYYLLSLFITYVKNKYLLVSLRNTIYLFTILILQSFLYLLTLIIFSKFLLIKIEYFYLLIIAYFMSFGLFIKIILEEKVINNQTIFNNLKESYRSLNGLFIGFIMFLFAVNIGNGPKFIPTFILLIILSLILYISCIFIFNFSINKGLQILDIQNFLLNYKKLLVAKFSKTKSTNKKDNKVTKIKNNKEFKNTKKKKKRKKKRK